MAAIAFAVTLFAGNSLYAQGKTQAIDPNALRILKSMTDYLDGMQQFTVTAMSTIEDLHSSGHRVDTELTSSVSVKRPNKLLAVRLGETESQSLYYDGKALTLYNPVERVYASQKAPETIEGAVTLARETIGIVFPAADLVYRKAYPLLTQDLTLAVVVGTALVDGVKCDHLLFSRPGADFQVWVEQGKRPLPHRYVVTETDTPSLLSMRTRLTDWNEAPALDDARFTFIAPQGATPTRFIPYGTTIKTGR
jgi:hypothetical protein